MSRRRRRKPSKPVESDRKDLWGTLYPTLDLHGRSADDAVHRVERWLDARRQEGDRVVRVITGRGLHSMGPPVLPNAIRALLRRLTGITVAEFAGEPGGGVFRVVLRPLHKQPPRLSRAYDTDLVRLAEEALSELGITPTPATIEAEIDRIVKERDRRKGL